MKNPSHLILAVFLTLFVLINTFIYSQNNFDSIIQLIPKGFEND